MDCYIQTPESADERGVYLIYYAVLSLVTELKQNLESIPGK